MGEDALKRCRASKLKRSPCVYPFDREREKGRGICKRDGVLSDTLKGVGRKIERLLPLPPSEERASEGKERLNSQILARGLRALLMTNDSGRIPPSAGRRAQVR